MDGYKRTALFRDNAPLSCANATDVSGFDIVGLQPTGTERRIVFSYEGDTADAQYFKLAVNEGAGEPTPVATQQITAESVLLEGNTVEELLAISSVPAFVGKTVYPVIALSAPEEQTAVPTIKLGIITGSNTALYERYEESAVFELAGEDIDIIRADAETVVTGNGQASVQVRFKTNGAWGEYTDIKKAANTKASAAQFRARYIVGTLDGTDSASIQNISMIYSSNDAKISGETTELLLATKHFSEKGANGLAFAQCLIKHKALRDAGIRAMLAVRSEVQNRIMYPIGTGTGERQTIQLPDTGIAYNTVQVQVNGEIVRGYSVNTETNEIAITADKGMAITASYEYGWENEEWVEMEKVACQPYDNGDVYATKFQTAIQDENKTVTCIKFILERTEDDVTDKTLAVATGDVQVFQLEHYARTDTIRCTGEWTYDEANRILMVQATKGEEIKISYHWVSESHEIQAIAAGWAKTAA